MLAIDQNSELSVQHHWVPERAEYVVKTTWIGVKVLAGAAIEVARIAGGEVVALGRSALAGPEPPTFEETFEPLLVEQEQGIEEEGDILAVVADEEVAAKAKKWLVAAYMLERARGSGKSLWALLEDVGFVLQRSGLPQPKIKNTTNILTPWVQERTDEPVPKARVTLLPWDKPPTETT